MRGKRLLHRWLAPIAWVATIGCATATPLAGPHGEMRYYIECSGLGAPLTACLDKADTLCRYGFRVLRVRTAGPPGVEGQTWAEKGIELPEPEEGEGAQSLVVECTGARLP